MSSGTCDRHQLHGAFVNGTFIHDFDNRVCDGMTVKPDPSTRTEVIADALIPFRFIETLRNDIAQVVDEQLVAWEKGRFDRILAERNELYKALALCAAAYDIRDVVAALENATKVIGEMNKNLDRQVAETIAEKLDE